MSTASETEAGHQHILSALDGKLDGKRGVAAPAAKASARRPGRPLLWGGLGVAALAVAAAGYTLLERDGEPAAPTALAAAELHPAPRAAAPAAPQAAPAPVPAAPATPVAPLAAEPVQAPAPAAVHEVPDEAAAKPLAELTPSAPAPAAAADKRGHADTLKQALERPSAAKAHAREHADARAAHGKEKAKEKDKAKEKAKDKAPARARREPDNDVTLLAALMAHIQPVNRKATPAEQLKVCKQYNAAGEEQCRARLCQSVARNEPACKVVPVVPVAKAPEES